MSRRKVIIPALLAAFVLLLVTAGPAFATGEAVKAFSGNKFIELTIFNAVFLFIVGFIGGLVSGFIGSGGAFVLTPAMMSLGVPGLVAVASNMCHKFPKALVGAIKRRKYGQVDLKLGLTLGVSASVGVKIGIVFQQYIHSLWGDAGSNLYVSFAFLVILITVGGYVFYDAWKTKKNPGAAGTPRLAQLVQKINIPPMMNFKTAGIRVSMWVTIPVGLATGLLAATIAVGGFIGVPGMIYVLGVSSLIASASELVIAFVMGFVGSTEWALVGNIDIRLVLLILAGSLFGVQLGALGTTYVKDHMIKVVMGSIMLIVALSRGFAIPKYTNQLGLTHVAKSLIPTLDSISFYIMAFALLLGAAIILGSMVKGMRQQKAAPGFEEVKSLEKAVN
ncbi:MAG: sulfite exporter TauE/SafE family protein [Candidatus Aquicultor sp.]